MFPYLFVGALSFEEKAKIAICFVLTKVILVDMAFSFLQLKSRTSCLVLSSTIMGLMISYLLLPNS